MRKNNVIQKRLSSNGLPQSMANSSEADIKEKASLKKSGSDVTSS